LILPVNQAGYSIFRAFKLSKNPSAGLEIAAMPKAHQMRNRADLPGLKHFHNLPEAKTFGEGAAEA
jgi:hypothetical protein